MTNSKEQRKKIEQELFSRFIHPSPSLKKKWEKRRQKQGNRQDILDQEIKEWNDEGKKLQEFKDSYKKRLVDELWNNPNFRHDIAKACDAYKNGSFTSAKELQEKYLLNFGWTTWLFHCIKTGENDPNHLIFYRIREKDEEKAKYISLDIYFPLPELLYTEANIYLRMQEAEIFGDYYNQQQSGGRKIDTELYALFEEWRVVGFDSKRKKAFRERYVANHPGDEQLFNDAMKRYRNKEKLGQNRSVDD